MSIINKKAGFNYEILNKYESGIVLLGVEVKSIRENRVNMNGSYVIIDKKDQLWIKNLNISSWKNANSIVDPLRERKLLLKKREIKKIKNKIEERGFTLIPTKIYFTRGLVKIEIALAKGKDKADKRNTLKDRDQKRDLAKKIKDYNYR